MQSENLEFVFQNTVQRMTTPLDLFNVMYFFNRLLTMFTQT